LAVTTQSSSNSKVPDSGVDALKSGEALTTNGGRRRTTSRERRRLKRQQERQNTVVQAAPARELRRVIIYVRVSSLAGRDPAASTTHTMRIQREKAEELARRNNWEVVDVIEHLDISGSRTNTADRLAPLLDRIERGDADGLVVYRVARFTRTQAGSIEAVERLLGAGAHLKAVDFDVDIHTPTGRFLLDIMVSIARAEAENIGANWRAVNEGNVARGIPHIVGFGYVRRKRDEKEVIDGVEVSRPGGSLVKDETLVGTPARPRWWWAREMFLRRGRGDGPAVIRDWLNDSGVRTPGRTGEPKLWVDGSVSSFLESRQVRGEVYYADATPHLAAHEPLVTETEWELAQSGPSPTTYTNRPQPLTGGLVRCAQCRYQMSWDKWGNTAAKHYCRGKNGNGACPTPRPRISVPDLDAHIEKKFLEWLHENALRADAASPDDYAVSNAQAVVDAGHAELEALKKSAGRFIAEFDEDEYFRQVSDVRSHLEAALDELDKVLGVSVIADSTDLAQRWPTLTVEQKRRHLHSVFGAVILRHEYDDAGNQRDIEDRVHIISRSDVDHLIKTGQLPTPHGVNRYKRIVPWPWPEKD
jgi:DNA invertase Pin-like site-specific DNA recombinase